MNIQFSDLLDFCFKESPPEKQQAIALMILMDEETFLIIRGLRLLKEKLGSKEGVQCYLEKNAEEAKKLCLADFARRTKQKHSEVGH